MKSKKVTMLVAALVVAVVAAAGVGYAAVTQYTATTTNTDNNMAYTYLKIEQDGKGAYTSNFFTGAYFNTTNTGSFDTTTNVATSETKYTPVYDSVLPVANATLTDGNTAALVSNKLKLTITPQAVGSTTTTAKLVVTVNSLSAIAGLTYTMVLATATTSGNNTTYTYNYVTEYKAISEAENAPMAWDFKDIAIDPSGAKDYVVMLFISGTTTNANVANINSAGFSADCVFTFTLTEPVA